LITQETEFHASSSPSVAVYLKPRLVVRADDDASYRELLAANYPLVEQVIRSVARHYHLRAEEAEELGSTARLKLVDNHYAVLRRFQRRSSLATYLTSVVGRICLDNRVAQWGKWRPSASALRQGNTAVALERLTGREGHTFKEACEV